MTQSVAVLIISFPKRASDGLVICALAGPTDNIDTFSSHLHATPPLLCWVPGVPGVPSHWQNNSPLPLLSGSTAGVSLAVAS